MKLVAYSYTPAWLGGVFALIPALGITTLLLAIYGFYVLYAAPVVNVPKERAVTFTATLVIAVIVVFIVTSAIIGAGMVGVMR